MTAVMTPGRTNPAALQPSVLHRHLMVKLPAPCHRMQPVGRPLVGSQYRDTTMESAKNKIRLLLLLSLWLLERSPTEHFRGYPVTSMGMTHLFLSELFVTNLLLFEHQRKNCSLLISQQSSGPYGVTKYGSG